MTQPSNAKPIGEIINKVLKDVKKRRGSGISFLEADWPEIIGERFAPEAAPKAIRKYVLYVRVTNAPLLSELNNYHKAGILAKLRNRYPDKTFQDIKFVL